MKRFTAVLSLILTMAFLLCSCSVFGIIDGSAETPTGTNLPATEPTETAAAATTASATTTSATTASAAEPTKTEPTATEPPEPPEPPIVDPFADAVLFSDLPKSKTALRYSDFEVGTMSGDTPISILVTVVQYTDGLEVDKEKLEDIFIGEYDFNNCIRSVSSYYRFNSYGKLKFNFTFLYYESDMTCEEAWHCVNDEDEDGHFYGNSYFFDIFNEMKEKNEAGIDYKDLDGDGDGCVDIAIFIFAEDSDKTRPGEGRYAIFGGAAGTTDDRDFVPDTESPVLKRYIKTDYESMCKDPAVSNVAGARTVIHEMGHALGLPDYYDRTAYEGRILDTLGNVDMMSGQYGDHNPFSKFAMGFIDPYVVDGIEDEMTVRISVSADHSDVILIPTSKGWNGTAFDEYILIDVLAPIGTAGFDWIKISHYNYGGTKNKEGGVRIYHVDARLEFSYYNSDTNDWEHTLLEDPLDASLYKNSLNPNVSPACHNSNGVEPDIEGISRFYHLVEVVPSDRSTKFRIHHSYKDNGFPWFFTTDDLYGAGDVFVLDETNESFADAPYMNNGGTLDYSVTVEAYDAETHEAIITIKRK